MGVAAGPWPHLEFGGRGQRILWPHLNFGQILTKLISHGRFFVNKREIFFDD